MTLPGWGQKVLLLAIIPVPQLDFEEDEKRKSKVKRETPLCKILRLIFIEEQNSVHSSDESDHD